jgi:recombination protein U
MNYPNGIKKEFVNKISHSNRGMNLEADLNDTNEYYRYNNIAIVYKKPTPITINKVDYKSRKDAVIKEAHFKVPSTTDYNGIYKGKYIDFEAKETKSLTSFPLGNIHKHQITHLESIYNHGGIGFIIIKFTRLNKTFLLFIEDLLNFINSEKRVSIPLSYLEEKGYIIKEGINPRLDYLKIIDIKGDEL